MIRTGRRARGSRRGGAPPRRCSPNSPAPGGGPAVGRLGNQSAARAAGLAWPSAGFGNAAGAAKNAGASVVCEFGAAPRPRARSAAPRTRRCGSTAFLEAITAGAEAGMKDHDRWLLARRRLEGKLKTRRSSSRLPALVEFMLARPIASAGMIASRAWRDAARGANHGRRARPPRDDRARPLSGLGNLVTIFWACRLICSSAWALDADRHAKTLMQFIEEGSLRTADLPPEFGRRPPQSGRKRCATI